MPFSSGQDGNMPFSSGQDSFSKFTMDLVRQYMKEEEVRAQHQSSLLRLRQKALREKTKAELAWLEHQKRQDKHSLWLSEEKKKIIMDHICFLNNYVMVYVSIIQKWKSFKRNGFFLL